MSQSTTVIHLMDFEWYNAPLSVYHHEDAVYFDRDQIAATMITATKRQLFQSRSIRHTETGIIYSTENRQAENRQTENRQTENRQTKKAIIITPTPPRQFKMLGEASVKELIRPLNADLYDSLVGTIIPYALRFIIRRDIRVMRTDMKLMQQKIAQLMTKIDARVVVNDDVDRELVVNLVSMCG